MSIKNKIGIYKIEGNSVTSGTMAKVVKAQHTITSERIALKLLPLPNEKYEKRFIQEAKILKSSSI